MIALSQAQRRGFSLCGCLLAFSISQVALTAAAESDNQPQITGKVDEAQLVRLNGNVRPEATAKHDRGPVADSMQLNHLQLELERPAAREAALEEYMQSTQIPGSPNYHHWLTAAQLGQQYGPDEADIAAVSSWLQSHGLQVNRVSTSGMLIDFSGTASQIAETFKTEIHSLEIKGEKHFANMSDPKIPSALAPVVGGIASLNDFRPRPASVKVHPVTAMSPGRTSASPSFTVNADYQLLAPADLHTIYNYTPLYQHGTTGTGQTVILLERTDISNADYHTFRKTFGLDKYKNGSFVVSHPGGCADPGVVVGDDFEATIDAEWAGASAPDAKIVLASCADTSTTFGPFVALEELVEERTPPAIVSLSYAGCEAAEGAAGNKFIRLLYQQAAAEGMSVYVAAGDWGAAMCDAGEASATLGISVSGFASTPYNLAAGGTDFSDTYSGTNGAYWSGTNASNYGSALSYIPEMPWNDSCASGVISSYLGYATPYGDSGFCNSPLGEEFLGVIGGSGGPSGCAYGATSPKDGTPAVSGSCRGYAKPIWQYFVPGVPNDGVRDIPDVSLFAANGIWGHYYVICYSDLAGGGVPCTGSPANWVGGGGTSFVAPILAGVQALVNQRTGERQGNPNWAFYTLAGLEYGFKGTASCNSSVGSNSCIFHDVTFGDNVVNCTGTNNCFDPSGPNGVLSVSDKRDVPAYGSHAGWDFGTGIGSINVDRLVNAWAAIP
jgi:subtilase family serine protease